MTMPAEPVVVGLGEVLWDVFPDAAHFGGAPANFACHAAALGAEAWVVSAIGQDELGRRARRTLEAHGVRTAALQESAAYPTGTVAVSIDQNGVASYQFAPEVAWDHLEWTQALEELAARCRAVCFGSLAQRSPISRATVHRFLSATAPDALRVFDVNLRQQFYDPEILASSLAAASMLKLNHDELPVLAQSLGLAPAPEVEALRELKGRFALRCVALTRGAQGSMVLWDGVVDEQKPPVVTVADTVGAGDAFTAALVLGLLRGTPLPVAHRHASDVAAYVCTQHGATPPLPPNLVHSA
jgi:fructokinase